MKNPYTLLMTTPGLAAALILNPSSAAAQTMQSLPPAAPVYLGQGANELGFRLGADAGVAVMQNFNSSRLGFPGHFGTEPGVRVDLVPEYDFLSVGRVIVGANFEGGIIYNHIPTITAAGVSTFAHGESYQVPLLANLVLKYRPDSALSPFIGVGGGGDYSRLRVNPSDFFGPTLEQDELEPAVQATVGVLYHLNPATEVALEYKMMAAFPSDDTLFSHAALATINFKF